MAVVGGFSVLGLLQPTETESPIHIHTQIHSELPTYPPTPPPLPEPVTETDIYLGLPQPEDIESGVDINTPIASTPPTPPAPSPLPAPSPPPEPRIELDIYGDSGCTEAISDIKWGPIEAGGHVSETIYVKNSGDQNINLSLYVENWDSVESSNHMSLSWDYDGNTVEPGSTVEVTLTLRVDPSAEEIDKFSFEILIIGAPS